MEIVIFIVMVFAIYMSWCYIKDKEEDKER